jgi:hypothetical protein
MYVIVNGPLIMRVIEDDVELFDVEVMFLICVPIIFLFVSFFFARCVATRDIQPIYGTAHPHIE